MGTAGGRPFSDQPPPRYETADSLYQTAKRPLSLKNINTAGINTVYGLHGIIRTSGSSKLISVPPNVDQLSNQIQSFVRVHVLYVYMPQNCQCLSLTNLFISSVSLKKGPLITLLRTPQRSQWAPYPIQHIF
jgi:hypothetical protein